MIKNLQKILIFILFSLNFLVFAQNNSEKYKLKKENAKFQTVLSGKALCPPEETSYGFCVLTDAKNLTAISNSGKILWEKTVQGNPEPYLTITEEDFIIQVSSKRFVSLYNPSGKQLWKKLLPFNINEKPFCGRDGRIFVRGNKNISCLGLNGIIKWNIETPEQDKILPQELNDGTILFFLKHSENNKSKALRVSPFGQIIATFTFSGLVSNALSCENGVLLAFKNGGLGLCKVEDNSTLTKWVHSSSESIFSSVLNFNYAELMNLSEKNSLLCLPLQNSTRFIIFENKSGKIISTFESSEINLFQKTFSSATKINDGFFISDGKNAVIFNKNGKILYSVNLPDNPNNKRWNFISHSSENTLIIAEKSWLFLGWKTLQELPQKNQQRKKTKQKDYSEFYSINTNIYEDETKTSFKIDKKLADEKRTNLLLEGNYGILEESWMSIILSFYKSYNNYLFQKGSYSTRMAQSIFDIDSTGTEILLNQLPILGTKDFPNEAARILTVCDDFTKITMIVRAARIFPYDPDSKILNQLEKILLKTPTSNTILLSEICDLVYEICEFMGRPALYSHGKEILTNLLFPKYSSKIREKARTNLIKLSESGI